MVKELIPGFFDLCSLISIKEQYLILNLLCIADFKGHKQKNGYFENLCCHKN